MKRYSLIQARGADSCGCMDGVVAESEGSDVVEMDIARGTVTMIVPATTPDESVGEGDWLQNHVCLHIELEDGRVLSGWVRSDEGYLEIASATAPAAKPSARASKKDFVRRTFFSKLGAPKRDATLVAP